MSKHRLCKEARAALDDLFLFCNYYIGLTLEEKPHREMCEVIQQGELDSSTPNSMLVVPRGTYKSSIATAAVTWKLLRQLYLHDNVYHRIVIASATLALGKATLQAIEGTWRYGGKNERIKEDYGDLWQNRDKETPGSKREDGIVWKPRIQAGETAEIKEPTVFIGSMRRISTGFHADEALIDDLNNKENVKTDHQRKQTHVYYRLLYPILGTTDRSGHPCRITMLCCVTGDTRVLLASGRWAKVIDISAGSSVVAREDNGALVARNVSAFIPQGKAETLKITTVRHSVEVSENHPFLRVTPQGEEVWTKAENLEVGDRVVTVSEYCPGNPSEWTDDQAWALGYMFGDGWVNKSKKRWHGFAVALGTNNKDLKRCLEILSKWTNTKPVFDTKKGQVRFESAKWARIFHGLGINGAKSKRLPDTIYTEPFGTRVQFIFGLLAADGHFIQRSRMWRLALCNKELIEDVVLLCMTSGFRHNGPYFSQRLIQPPNSPSPVLASRWDIIVWNTSNDHYKTGCRLETIRAITPAGVNDVYDLSVDENHNFVAGGFITHNTPWHDDDVRGMVLREEKERKIEEPDRKSTWIVLQRSAINEDGTAYFPTKYPVERLDELRRHMGVKEFTANYLGDCVGDNGFVNEDEIHFKDSSLFPGDLRHGRISVDPNQHKDAKELGCYAACVVTAYDRFGKMYVLDAIGSREWDTRRFINALFDLQDKYEGWPIFMEDSHMSHFSHSVGLEESARSEREGRHIRLRINYTPVDYKTSKYERWERIQPRFKNHSIVFADSIAPSIKIEIKDELVRGEAARFKDFLDALALAETGYRPKIARDGSQVEVVARKPYDPMALTMSDVLGEEWFQ